MNNAFCHSRSMLTILTIASLSFMWGKAAPAQTVTGSVYGTVADASGAVIPGSTITITDIDTNETHSTRSNGTGTYIFPVLSPGNYTVSSVAAGFGTVNQSGVRLAANQNVNVSFTMKAGEVTTAVDVQAGTTLVDTRESTISTTIDQARIADLPLVARSAYDLLTTVPGITNYNTASSQIGDFNGVQFSTNGLPAGFNSFYLDGSYNTEFFRGGGGVLPNPDALGEFSVLTSNQDAEFGRYPGAVVNTITRSGSNQFHGVAYDFLRNTAFTAKNYFADSVTPLHYNVFGVGVGGPVLRNKLFAYLNYQGTRIHTPDIITSASIIVPSALERAGNFSQSAKKPTGTGCVAPAVPVAPATICVDPVAAAMLKYVPLAINSATDPTATTPPQQDAPGNTTADQGVARLDYQLNAAHKLQFTFFQSQGTLLDPAAGTSNNAIYDFSGSNDYAAQSNYVVGDTWIVSPRAVNSFRASYSLTKTIESPQFSGARLADLGSQIPEGDSLGLSTQPHAAITAYFTMGGNNSSNDNEDQLQYAISDTFNYSRGRHTAKFGGELIEARYQLTSVSQGSTVSTFTGSSTKNALADFMEGHANSFLQDNGLDIRTHAPDPSLFAQDDWHISKRLTLDLGVRWEVFYPFAGQNDVGTFVPGVQSTRFPTAPVGLLSSGDPEVPDGILHVSYSRFAPRVGFADDLLGNGRLSLRGAYGIFYAANQEQISQALEQEPFALSVSIPDTTSYANPYAGVAAFNGVSPFPYTLTTPKFVAGASLDALKPYTAATPYVQEYNLALQQQFGNNWSMQIAYVGNTSRSFYYARDENAPIYSPAATTSSNSIQSRRPYQPEGQIDEQYPGDNSSYSSLQVSVTKRFSHGFSLLASYVWSKTLDIVDVAPHGSNDFYLADEADPGMDYGLSSNDLPQAFVASYLYALPGVNRYGLFGKEVLSGWQINGITTLDTGGPFNILSNTDTNFDGIATDRPNVVGNPFLGYGRTRAQKIAEFFNTSAYAVPPTGQLYGDSPRNPLVGPGYVDTDLSAFKRFALYKHSDLLFRGEVFNAFNNVNLSNPNGTLGSAKYGTITAASSPRIVQLALKLEF